MKKTTDQQHTTQGITKKHTINKHKTETTQQQHTRITKPKRRVTTSTPTFGEV